MVSPTSSSGPSSSYAALQHNSGVTSAANEEGCNDEPPPIPLPPAGNLAGGAQDQLHSTVPSQQDASNLTLRAARDENNQFATSVARPKVHDYAVPGVDGLYRLDSNGFSSTTSTTTAHSTPSAGRSRNSTQSSLTAVDKNEGEVSVTITAGIPSVLSLDGANAHTMTSDSVATSLKTDLTDGLDGTDAKVRLEKEGLNKLTADEGVAWWTVLFRQVSNSLTLVLVIAMAASYGMLDYIEGSVISAVILLNIVIGFVQDYRAEQTMQSLHSLSAPIATVIRNRGHIEKIRAEELVKGDIVKLHVGDVVPADLRLFEGMNIEADESLLTGESLPIPKEPGLVMDDLNAPTGDRTNMAWASSTVTKGRAVGIVVATGMNTQVGRIAGLLNGEKSEEGSAFQRFLARFVRGTKNVLGLVGTPLQVKLSKFALVLFGLAILLAIIVFSASKWDINDQVLIYGICVAVAVIPESLIAVLTITMAVGTKTMAKVHVIVRKLQALEAVGGVTDVCSDKTGTLTQGKMIARRAYIPGLGMLTVHDTASPFDPTSGQVKHGDNIIDGSYLEKSKPLKQFLHGIALCNLSAVSREDPQTSSSDKLASAWTASGEPTEISLQVLAMRFGAGKPSLLESGNWELLAEHPFDSTVKRMSVVYRNLIDGNAEVFMKGAGEVIIPTLNISEQQKSILMGMIETFASEGLRVLCVAHKTVTSDDSKDINNRKIVEDGLDFLGLVGLYDPPRPETKGAVRTCQIAGVKVHMLTGDHIRTATAIAHEVGILSPAIPSRLASSMVMAAPAFDAMTEAAIDAMPELPLVIARCSPATKVRMVEALHRRKAFCVMTGDGVNDSPALKRADVGIAMGLSGSDVAKDASDLVLTDDNFASIVRAVEEGRRLFDNIQKFLMHLLISNISQVVLLLIGLACQDSQGVSIFPLSPLEILWVNMITSSFLAMGLGLEEAQPDIMTRPPHDLKQGVFTWELIIDKTIYGVTMGVLCLSSFLVVVYGAFGGDLGHDCNKGYNSSCDAVFRARATVFAVLSFLLLITAWEVKHFARSLFRLNPARHTGPFAVFHALWYNRFLFWAVIAGFVITFPVIYIPVFNTVVFKHMAITWEWGVVIAATTAYLCVVEGWKAIKRWRGWGSARVWKNSGTDLESGDVSSTTMVEKKDDAI